MLAILLTTYVKDKYGNSKEDKGLMENEARSAEAREAEAAARCLAKLKEEHRAGLAKLKTALHEERAWKLGEMQAAMKAAKLVR